MSRKTAASVFFLETPLGRGYGGHLSTNGIVSFLLLPLYKTKKEAAEKIRERFGQVSWDDPPNMLLSYLDSFFQGKPLPPSFPFYDEDAPLFFRKIYEACQRIPWGRTATYAEVAEEAGNRKAARAAGQALARNKLPLLIPCHRVVSQRSPGGFSYGISIKQKLLRLERESDS